MDHKKYALEVGPSDLDRMTLLGNIYKHHNTQFILKCGLTAGMHVADIGCGPGNMSMWFAENVGTTGSVTAIDNSDEQLSLLKEQLISHHVSHVIPKKLDIYELADYIEQKFDVVYCRFLMVHLHEPQKAIAQLKKILKPHGCLIVAELDNQTWYSYPTNIYLQKDVSLLCQTGKLRGIDLEMGKKIYSYFRKSDMKNIKVDIAQPVLEKEDRQYLISKVQAWGKKYLEHNLITEDELKDLFNNIKQLVLNQDYLLLGARMFQIAGTV